MTFSVRLSAGHQLAQAEAGPVNSTKLVHVNAISNLDKINIQGIISPWECKYIFSLYKWTRPAWPVLYHTTIPG
jgi:hypothetical protein